MLKRIEHIISVAKISLLARDERVLAFNSLSHLCASSNHWFVSVAILICYSTSDDWYLVLWDFGQLYFSSWPLSGALLGFVYGVCEAIRDVALRMEYHGPKRSTPVRAWYSHLQRRIKCSCSPVHVLKIQLMQLIRGCATAPPRCAVSCADGVTSALERDYALDVRARNSTLSE